MKVDQVSAASTQLTDIIHVQCLTIQALHLSTIFYLSQFITIFFL